MLDSKVVEERDATSKKRKGTAFAHRGLRRRAGLRKNSRDKGWIKMGLRVEGSCETNRETTAEIEFEENPKT